MLAPHPPLPGAIINRNPGFATVGSALAVVVVVVGAAAVVVVVVVGAAAVVVVVGAAAAVVVVVGAAAAVVVVECTTSYESIGCPRKVLLPPTLTPPPNPVRT
jgi:hypothetical protein